MLHQLPLTFITEVLSLAADVRTSIEIMPLVNEQLIAIQNGPYSLLICAFYYLFCVPYMLDFLPYYL